jgi:5'-methylthioinosine phosphorylase
VSVLGIIGGTGIEELDGLVIHEQHELATPFGAPSRPVQQGQLGEAAVFFLHRHGAPAAIPPHRVNYRANIWALKSLGVTEVVGINAVGGIGDDMRPGRLVIPEQIIDYTWGREHTFDDGSSGELLHVDFTEPYDRELRLALINAATSCDCDFTSGGVHGVAQGPRLETAAEVRRMAQDGCDLVGMTGMPEAALARELGLAYASLCMVVNPAAGLGSLPLSLAMMREILARESSVVRDVLRALVAARYAPS